MCDSRFAVRQDTGGEGLGTCSSCDDNLTLGVSPAVPTYDADRAGSGRGRVAGDASFKWRNSSRPRELPSRLPFGRTFWIGKICQRIGKSNRGREHLPRFNPFLSLSFPINLLVPFASTLLSPFPRGLCMMPLGAPPTASPSSVPDPAVLFYLPSAATSLTTPSCGV